MFQIIAVPLPSKTAKMLSLGKMRARSLLLSLNRIIAAELEIELIMIRSNRQQNIIAKTKGTYVSVSPLFFVNKLEYCSFLKGGRLCR